MNAFEMIETPQLAARLSVASNLSTFIRAARLEDAVQTLVTYPTAKIELRLLQVLRSPFQQNVRNPLDVAAAVYLWILGSKNHEAAAALAQEVLAGDRGSWWWSSQIAERMIGHTKTIAKGAEGYLLPSRQSATFHNVFIPNGHGECPAH